MRFQRLLLAMTTLSVVASALAADPGPKPYIPNPVYSAKAKKTALMAEGPFHFSTYTQRQELPSYFATPNPELEEEELAKMQHDAKYYGQARGRQDLGAGPAASSLVTHWAGIQQPSGLRPPDNDSATAADWVVQVVNESWAIYDKCGNLLHQERFSTTTGSTDFLFDPKVTFDPWSRRWVMLIHEKRASTMYLDVIVSDDENPNGNWWFYRFGTGTGSGATNSWSDYYEMSYSSNAIYLAGNQFTFASDSFTGAQFIIIDKADMYNAVGANWWRYIWSTNDLQSDRFAMRPAEMMSVGSGFDTILVSTNRSGGTHAHWVKFADPFGAQTFSYGDVNIADYSSAPNATQPNGDVLFGFDARVMNAVHVNDSAEGTGAHVWFGFMVSHNWGSGNVMASRFVNFNPANNAIRLDSDWGADLLHYGFPVVVGNYRGGAIYSFSRCGSAAPNYPEIRFSEISKSGGSWVINSSNGVHPTTPTTAYYDSNRWGDYFGGSLDWGDYYYNGEFSSGFQKHWVYGEFAVTTAIWGSASGAVAVNASTGAIAVDNPNPTYFYGVGTVGNPNTNFVVSTAGVLGSFFEVIAYPNWLTPTTGTTGEVYDATSRTVTFQVNNNADALPFGRHVATITFRNCYTGATINRNITLSLGQYNCPGSYVLLSGVDFAGGIGDVCTSNNVYHRFLSDESNLETDLWYTFPGLVDGGQYIYWYLETASNRLGLTQVVYLWNSDNGSWVQVDGRVAPINDTFIGNGAYVGNPYITSAGNAYMRVRTLPTNDEDPALDGWVLNIDYAQVYEYP